MRIVITSPELTSGGPLFTKNVTYMPWLEASTTECRWIQALVQHNARALICTHRPPSTVLSSWSRATGDGVFVAYASGRGVKAADPAIYEHPQASNSLAAASESLAACERWFVRNELDHGAKRQSFGAGRKVLLVGAGVVNLITGLWLLDAGYHVEIRDRSPEPGRADWQSYGCTHGGDDARMFTLTEMDNYNDKELGLEPRPIFQRPLSHHGWLIGRAPLSPAEQRWIDEFYSIPPWLALNYNEDIFALTSRAEQLWISLQAQYPALFEGVDHHRGILRLYSDQEHLSKATKRHDKLGATLRRFTAPEIAGEFPALAAAVRNGELAGGLFVKGFTVNIHKFCMRLIHLMKQKGGVFLWTHAVDTVQRGPGGVVRSVLAGEHAVEADHFVLSPGVYGEALLKGSACEGKIQGVLGGWIRISQGPAVLSHSLKLARKGHVTEDANISVTTDRSNAPVLILGSGYGYTGLDPGNIAQDQLDLMYAGLLDTARRLFPDSSVFMASEARAGHYGFKYCVRPWTSTSLGIFHAEAVAEGGAFIVAGGHNTGGFTHAPVVAEAVLATLRGEPHAMQAIYHPARLTEFLAT